MTQPVSLYSKDNCSYCTRAKNLLNQKGIAFTEIRIDLDERKRDEMVAKGGGRKTVPQIFIGTTHVGGFDDLYALESTGQLDKLLQG